MNQHTCPDCGPAPTNHAQAYFAVLMDKASVPFNSVALFFRRKIIAPLLLPLKLDRLALPCFKLLSKLGLGSVNLKPDARNNSRTQALWESADRLGIVIYEFRLFGRPLDTFVATSGNQSKFFYEIPRPNKPLSKGFWIMDDKPAMRRLLSAAGIPIALGDSCFSYAKALKAFHNINGEVITKPSYGSRSRHTTVHIKTELELKMAFHKAKQLSPFVLVEQQLQGQIYRASVIGRKLQGVISRNPPNVIGDGIHTIQQLIETENQNPKRHTEAFHTIPVDEECRKELNRQGYSLDSIPKTGTRVMVSDKVSRGVGAVTVDYTDQTHPDNRDLFEKVAQVLDDECVGMDFIIEDISKSWREQKLCGIIECNSAPFLDLHHYPYQGQPRDVSSALWRLVFALPEPQPEKAPQTV